MKRVPHLLPLSGSAHPHANIPVPSPVRDWLGRIAGSLVLGAFIGSVLTYYVFTPVITTSVYSSCNAGPAADGARFGSAAWTTLGGEQHTERDRHHPSQHQHQEEGGMLIDSGDYIGDHLDDALFAARAGEAAAQQGLLVRTKRQEGNERTVYVEHQFVVEAVPSALLNWSFPVRSVSRIFLGGSGR